MSHSITEIKSRLLQVLADLDQLPPYGLVSSDPTASTSEATYQIARSLGASGLAGIAERLLKESDARANNFDIGLFADPAWHILLDLFVAEARGRKVQVSSLCIAARVPATTALRWIKNLEDRGLVDVRADSEDARRRNVTLRPEALEGMAAYLARISGIGALPARNGSFASEVTHRKA